MYRTGWVAGFCLFLLTTGCSPALRGLPTIVDEKVENYVTEIGLEIVAVSEHRDRRGNYRFKLADFARRDILGLSVGGQQIFISYKLARLAYESGHYRWLLRHTLAHEIAHDVLGRDPVDEDDHNGKELGLANRITGRDLGLPERIRFRPYSRTAELAADRKGMEYWHRLGWQCGHWVRLFLNFAAQGYTGDVDHPTLERLEQAVKICSEQSLAGVPMR
jgi:predicted Zn-dependent protease